MAESSADVPRRNGPGRPFPKGVSGNPGGRPALVREVRDLAQQLVTAGAEEGQSILHRLAELAHSSDGRVAVAACKELLDRAVGRAPAALTLQGPDGGPVELDAAAWRRLTEEELYALRSIAARLVEAP